MSKVVFDEGNGIVLGIPRAFRSSPKCNVGGRLVVLAATNIESMHGGEGSIVSVVGLHCHPGMFESKTPVLDVAAFEQVADALSHCDVRLHFDRWGKAQIVAVRDPAAIYDAILRLTREKKAT